MIELQENGNNSFSNCRIVILGNENHILLNQNNSFSGVEIWIEDNGNKLKVGNGNSLHHHTHIALTEGQEIEIGNGNLISSNCWICTGDSHSILSKDKKQRLNPAKSVKIHNHNWIGAKVSVLKGVEIQNDSIVGAGSLVTRPFKESNVILAGNPAEIVRKDITWSHKRI